MELKDLIITGGRFRSPGNIPTGYFKLDFAIHHGCDPTRVDLNVLPDYDPSVPLGLPLGKVVEFFGEEGGGKSSIAYRVAGNAQKLGHNVVWIDAECSFSEDLARINGCDIDGITLIATSHNDMRAEDVLHTVINLCKEKNKISKRVDGKKILVDPPKVVIVDSLASLVPMAVDESTPQQQFMGLLARLFSQNMGKVAAAAEKNGVLLIFINQLREKIGVTFGSPEVSPGGRALKHHFSVRLKVTRRKSKDANIEMWDEDLGVNVLIGGHSYVRLEKNRFAKPYFDSIEIPMYYECYFPGIEEIAFDTGRQLRLISIYKGVFNWDGLKIEGRKKFISHIKENNLTDKLIDSVKKMASEKGVILPPEINLYVSANDGVVDEKLDNREISGDGKKKDSSSRKDNAKKTRRKKSP